MKREFQVVGTSAALLVLMALASIPAKAQNSPPPSSENLPSKPEPTSNYKLKSTNPYEYSSLSQTPNIPTHEPIDTTPVPLATQLVEPFGAASSEPAQSGLPVSQKRIRVSTNEVIVPVTVLNDQGELVLDLAQKDFHVFDNGVEQSIDHWDLGGDPLAVALVLETSSHIQMMAPVIRGMGSIFTETVMALSGEAAVITYDSTVDLRQPFTTDHYAVERAIKNADFDAPEMRLYDAMGTAVDLLKTQQPKFRRVMLVVGESQDLASDSKLALVLRDAQLANVSIYAVGPSTTTADLRFGRGAFGGDNQPVIVLPKPLPSIYRHGPGADPIGRPYFDLVTPAMWLITRGINEIKNHQLELAVAATGGVHYRAVRDSTIRSALDQIGGELHAQYVIAYTPASERTAGFHTIAVTVTRPNTIVRARPGYFVVEPGDLTTPISSNSPSPSKPQN
ncbi:MAG: VWA domain-containing protein [Candidatus Acidiferrales bacterium]